MQSAFSEYLTRNEGCQFRLLRELVLQPSYSHDKTGVDSVGQILIRELSDLHMDLQEVRQTQMGNHLIFRSPACSHHSRSILLAGHMDTVFPPESHFNWYKEEGEKVYGPGVIDMKGGLAVAVFALKALQQAELLNTIPITFICNSDEEIGSPTSKELIHREAGKSLLGLVFECGGLQGEIVTGRKGKTGYTLDVKGKAGHAAFSGLNKASAILELARKIIAIEQLNDPGRQLVVNVGVVQGGIGPNTVPDSASALIDTRYLNTKDGRDCYSAIRHIAETSSTPNTSAILKKTSSREPMEQTISNSILFKHLLREAEQLNLSVKEELRSGVSDANVIASAGIPVIDGLGPIGDCDHSDREYMIRKSLPQRTLLTACSIFSAWQMLLSGELCFS